MLNAVSFLSEVELFSFVDVSKSITASLCCLETLKDCLVDHGNRDVIIESLRRHFLTFAE